jgi:hypothetical protein
LIDSSKFKSDQQHRIQIFYLKLNSKLCERGKSMKISLAPIGNFRFLKYSLTSFIITGLFANTAMADGRDGLLNIIRNAPENSWIQMNTNKFSDAWVPFELRANQSSYANPATIINAWSSFAWDSNRGDLLLFGGGHANYAGNEVYRWKGATQQWERASLPSAIDYNTYLPIGGAEHAPQASHTYDNSVFLPKADRFVTFGGAAFQSGSAFAAQNPDGSFRRTGPYFFDPSKTDPNKVGGGNGTGVGPNSIGGNMWTNRDIYAKPGFASNPPGSVEGTTDYAFENGKEVIYISGPDGGGTNHRLARLTITDYNDPSKDVWEALGMNWYGSGGKGAGAYDPVHNIYIKTYTGDTPFTFWNLDNPGPFNINTLVRLAASPDDFSVTGQYGLEYDPIRDRFLLWGGGGDVFQLDVGNKDGTNWIVTDVSTEFSAKLPAAVVNNGVLGKWHYASDLDVFVGLEGPVDGNVWFYKPTGWVDSAPVPLPGGIVLMLSGMGFWGIVTRRKNKVLGC